MAILPLTRRQLMMVGTSAYVAAQFPGTAAAKSRVGLVQSTHPKLSRRAGPGQELDYPQVREMVWKAIEYGRPAAGSLAAKIKPGSWVVIKPNLVFLMSQSGYRTGDTTDLRVIRAVMEYVAEKSPAARITLAEGGSYRSVNDPLTDNVVTQKGVRRDAYDFDWDGKEFPGTGGSIADMLCDFSAQYPSKKFDYIDLCYDVVRDPSGAPAQIEVPNLNGAGSFSNVSRYSITNTIRDCDFLITVPVAKIHENCGITACFKSYVGTAPRVTYAVPGQFWNSILHGRHSVDARIDPFIADLAAFHPPDYNVVDVIRGLQTTEHNNNQPDQMLRHNIVLAGEDTVAVDAAVATLLGFRPADIDFLRMGAARGLGALDLGQVEIVGDELDRFAHTWTKPRNWYARCNREWRVSGDPDAGAGGWKRHTSFGDILYGEKALEDPVASFAAASTLRAAGHRKGFLWLGLTGKATVLLDGQEIVREESLTRFRVGQFQQPVELTPGVHQLVVRLQGVDGKAPRFAALMVGQTNNGDSLDGVEWSA